MNFKSTVLLGFFLFVWVFFNPFFLFSQKICRKGNWETEIRLHPLGHNGRLGQLLLHIWWEIRSQTTRYLSKNVWEGMLALCLLTVSKVTNYTFNPVKSVSLSLLPLRIIFIKTTNLCFGLLQQSKNPHTILFCLYK